MLHACYDPPNQDKVTHYLGAQKATAVRVAARSIDVVTSPTRAIRICRQLTKEIDSSSYWRVRIYDGGDLPCAIVQKSPHLQPIKLVYQAGSIVRAECAIQLKADWLMRLDYPIQQILALVESGKDLGVIQFEQDRYRWKFDAEIVRSESAVKIYLFDQERWQGWFWSDPRHIAKVKRSIES